MPLFLKKLSIILISFFTGFLLFAQASMAQNPTPEMQRFSQMEDRILQERWELLERENEVNSPIWVLDSQGMYQIIDGAELRTRAEGLSSIVELMAVEGSSIDGAGFINDMIAQMIAAKIASVDPAGKVMSGYIKQSSLNRSAALRSFEEMLEYARTQFFLERDKRDAGLRVGTHPCQQVQSTDARRFFFRFYGNSDWRLFVQNGGFYCGAPHGGASFRDNQYYAYVTISGEYISYTECPGGECVTSPLNWKAIHENQGDRYMRGAVYKDVAQEATNGWEATFSWWQCYPIPASSDGTNMCPEVKWGQ